MSGTGAKCAASRGRRRVPCAPVAESFNRRTPFALPVDMSHERVTGRTMWRNLSPEMRRASRSRWWGSASCWCHSVRWLMMRCQLTKRWIPDADRDREV